MLTDGVITLRRPSEADVAAIVAACQDPEIPRWTAVPSPYTEADAHAYLAQGDERFLITDAGGRLLGAIRVRDPQTAPELGYWLAAHARGRGVATRAVTLLRDWTVATYGARRVLLAIHRENLASQRVALRAGFRDTGHMRPSRHRNDGIPDHIVFAWEPEPD